LAITNPNTFSADRAGGTVLRSATVDHVSAPLSVTLDGTAGIPADKLASYSPTLNDVVAVLVKATSSPTQNPGVLVLGVVS
jgi:hypothetical protein